jgi:predicted DsbA family dithiol-disulfide isomerase
MAIDIEVYSDAICPWCFVGKRRLEKALAKLGSSIEACVVWRPYELNPGMPRGGMERRQYRSAKFGSWERSQALDARLMEVGAEEGISFAFDRMERTPNTLDAHRLIGLAHREGVQDAVVEGLFHAYFLEGADIGDNEVLIRVAIGAGMGGERVRSFLRGDEGVTEVRAAESLARQLGIDSVPTFIINGRYSIPGAQPVETMARVLREIAVEAEAEPSVSARSGTG